MEGDNFFVYKAAYGYSKQSFPLGIIDFEGRVFPAVPTRGDVVVFKARQGQVYVKRIIGMPGETIQMRDGVVYINGEAVRQNVTDEAADPDEGPDAKIVVEILPNGMSYKILDVDPNSVLDNTREYLVPEGEFFMLGDHRDNSNDSRLSLGSIPFENLIGRAERIFANTNGRAFANRRSLRATSMKGG